MVNNKDAVGVAAAKLNIDLSATIAPDTSKGAGAVGAAISETTAKIGNYQQLETALAKQTGVEPGGSSGPAGAQGLSRGMASMMLAGLGLMAPVPNIEFRPAAPSMNASPLTAPGVHQHAALIVGGPSKPVAASSTDDKKKPYEDALGGLWNSDGSTYAAAAMPQQQGTPTLLPQRSVNRAAAGAIEELGSDEVRKDLGQVAVAKKRLGQQMNEALDGAERLGAKTDGIDRSFGQQAFAPRGPAAPGMI